MTPVYRVVALPGEGIGSEVVNAALTILQQVAHLEPFAVDIDFGLIGEAAQQQWGTSFPAATAQRCEAADGIVFGAVSRGGLLELRKQFDLFANLRPVKPFPALLDKSSLKPEKLVGVDLLFVRELAGGIYFGPAGRTVSETGHAGYHTMSYTDGEIQRIAQVALKQAQQRRGLVTVAHKENALPHLPWVALTRAEAVHYPGVKVEPMLVDNFALQLVSHPQRFDVILAGNLFGDILSEIAAAFVGSLGLLGSASLNTQGLGLYEPCHGTAPNIAGKGIANPLGMVNSVVLMLEQWGETRAAQRLIQAQHSLLAKGYRTADLHPQGSEVLVNTQELVERFCQELLLNQHEFNT